jgi:hypothetical protein
MTDSEGKSNLSNPAKNNPQEQPQVTPTEPPPDLTQEPAANQTTRSQTSRQAPAYTPASEKRWYSDLSLPDWITAVSTLLIMLWAFLQWREMHNGGIDTHALADAAGRQASAAQQFATSAGQIKDGVNGAVSQLQTAVDKLQAMAQASSNSVTAARKAMQLDERAWIAVDQIGIKVVPAGKDLGSYQIVAVLKNTGRTPAHAVHSIAGTYFKAEATPPGKAEEEWMNLMSKGVDNKTIPQGVLVYPEDEASHIPAKAGVLMKKMLQERRAAQGPGLLPTGLFKDNVVETPTLGNAGVLSPQITFPLAVHIGSGWITGINNTLKETLVVYGTITYRDNFKRVHKTVFCGYKYDTAPTDFSVCPVHNDMK